MPRNFIEGNDSLLDSHQLILSTHVFTSVKLITNLSTLSTVLVCSGLFGLAAQGSVHTGRLVTGLSSLR